MLSGREAQLPVHNADFKLVEIDQLKMKSSCLFELEAVDLHTHTPDWGIGFIFRVSIPRPRPVFPAGS